MPATAAAHLVACANLAEAQQLSARVRAGLPPSAFAPAGAGLPDGGPELGNHQYPAGIVPLAELAGQQASPAPDRLRYRGDGHQPLTDLQRRLDRLEQALASAGTFA